MGVGNSLVVQWLGFCTSTTGGVGQIPGWGTKTSYAAQFGKEKKKKKNKEREIHVIIVWSNKRKCEH